MRGRAVKVEESGALGRMCPLLASPSQAPHLSGSAPVLNLLLVDLTDALV